MTQRPIGLRFFFLHTPTLKIGASKRSTGWTFLIPGEFTDCMHLPNTGKVKFAEFPGPLKTKYEHYSANQEEGQ